jgi:hypothetical protein
MRAGDASGTTALEGRADLAAWLLVALATVGTGCGECVFAETIQGAVHDQNGNALAGAVVESCGAGERCVDAPSDMGCVRVVTDAAGRYTLEVQQCRPAAFQCALRPLRVSHAGCAAAVVYPTYGSSLADVRGAEAALSCP